jgi:hypothetical protein
MKKFEDINEYEEILNKLYDKIDKLKEYSNLSNKYQKVGASFKAAKEYLAKSENLALADGIFKKIEEKLNRYFLFTRIKSDYQDKNKLIANQSNVLAQTEINLKKYFNEYKNILKELKKCPVC